MTSVAKRRCAKRETGRRGSFGPKARKITSRFRPRWGLPFIPHGVLNDELFFSPGVGNEMMFVFAKVQPFLKEIREKTQSPMAFTNLEKAISKSKTGKTRFATILKRVEGMRKSMRAAA